MNIAYVSTYPPKACGIASYTDTVALAVAKQPGVDQVSILSEIHGQRIHESVDVYPCFRSDENFLGSIMAAVDSVQPDLVHIQHAPDILGMDKRLYDLLDTLGAAGVKRVFTPHTIYDFKSGLIERKPGAPLFNRRFGERSDAIIAHQPSMTETLVKHGVDRSKIHLIPHWTGPMPDGDDNAIRSKIGLDESHKLVLFFGFIHVQKNIHTPIKAMRKVVDAIPKARLVVAGSIAGNAWYNRLYTLYLKRLIHQNRLQEHVILDTRFIPNDDMDAYYAAADLIVLPHLQGYGSASGVAHQALAARKPMLCSDAPKFEEIGTRISKDLVIPSSNSDAWAAAMVSLLQSGADEALLQKVARYAEETSIEATAANHVGIYRKLLSRS